MSRKKRKAQAVEVPDIEASGKDMYDWVQCLIVALIICVVFFAFFVLFEHDHIPDLRLIEQP